MNEIELTKVGLDLIGFAARNGRASAVDLLEEYIEETLSAPGRFAVSVLLAGNDPEDVQEWLSENE